MDINTRMKEIEELDAFILEKNKSIFKSISNLGWSKESLSEEVKCQCPVDPGHWVHESALSQHTEMCRLMKDGYLKEDTKKQPPSSNGFYQHTSVMSLTIDKETLANILIEKGLMEKSLLDKLHDIPKTMDRWTVELTPEQRLAVYDYIVQEAKSSNQPTNLTLEDLMFDFEKKGDQDQRPKTEAEIMAEQRDYKRRRQSYRAKNVHITKKSYTEVMKEVIENQISFLAETKRIGDNDSVNEDSFDQFKEKDDCSRHPPKVKEDSLDGDNTDYRRNSKREESPDGDRHRHSRRNHSSSPPSKKRKHKHKRSRSRSRSRHHKKSHKHKHKKSRDT